MQTGPLDTDSIERNYEHVEGVLAVHQVLDVWRNMTMMYP